MNSETYAFIRAVRGAAKMALVVSLGLSLWLTWRHYSVDPYQFTDRIYAPKQVSFPPLDFDVTEALYGYRQSVNVGLGVVLRVPVSCCAFHDAQETAAALSQAGYNLPEGVTSFAPYNGEWLALLQTTPLAVNLVENRPQFNDAGFPRHRVAQFPTQQGFGAYHTGVEWGLESQSPSGVYRNHFAQIDIEGRRLNAVLIAPVRGLDKALYDLNSVLDGVSTMPPSSFDDLFILNAEQTRQWLVVQSVLLLLLIWLLPAARKVSPHSMAQPLPGKPRQPSTYNPDFCGNIFTANRPKPKNPQPKSYAPNNPFFGFTDTQGFAFADGTDHTCHLTPEQMPTSDAPTNFGRSHFKSHTADASIPRSDYAPEARPAPPVTPRFFNETGLQIKRLSHVLPDFVEGNTPLMPSVLYVGIGGAGINTIQHALSIDMPDMGHAVMDSQVFNAKTLEELRHNPGQAHYKFSSKPLRYSRAFLRLPSYYAAHLSGENLQLGIALFRSQDQAIDEMLEGTSLLLLTGSAGSFAAERQMPALMHKAIQRKLPTLAILSVPFGAEQQRQKISDSTFFNLAFYGVPFIRFDNTRIPETMGMDAGMFESICAQTDWMNLLAWSVAHLHQQGQLQSLLKAQGEITFSHAEHTARESLASLVTRAIKNQQIVETGWEGRKAMIVVISSIPPRDRNYKKAVLQATKETGLENPSWLHIQDERLGEHKYAIVLGMKNRGDSMSHIGK